MMFSYYLIIDFFCDNLNIRRNGDFKKKWNFASYGIRVGLCCEIKANCMHKEPGLWEYFFISFGENE